MNNSFVVTSKLLVIDFTIGHSIKSAEHVIILGHHKKGTAGNMQIFHAFHEINAFDYAGLKELSNNKTVNQMGSGKAEANPFFGGSFRHMRQWPLSSKLGLPHYWRGGVWRE